MKNIYLIIILNISVISGFSQSYLGNPFRVDNYGVVHFEDFKVYNVKTTNIELFDSKFKHAYITSANATSFKLRTSKFHSVHVDTFNGDFFLVSWSDGSDLNLDGLTIRKSFNVEDSSCDSFTLSSCIFQGNVIVKYSSFAKEFKIQDCEFKTYPQISNFQLPESLVLNNLNLIVGDQINSKQKFDLRNVSKDSLLKNGHKYCKLTLTDVKVDHLIIPYGYFDLKFETSNFEHKLGIYEGIMKSCENEGMLESKKMWDIESKMLRNAHYYGRSLSKIINRFNKYWWNFGYNKERILVFWLPGLFLFFYFINLFMIKKLITNMYRDDELGSTFFSERKRMNLIHEIKKPYYKFSYTLFYTATIYFGLKLRHESVNYSKIGYVIYLYFIYAIGTLQLAFSLSYIISS